MSKNVSVKCKTHQKFLRLHELEFNQLKQKINDILSKDEAKIENQLINIYNLYKDDRRINEAELFTFLNTIFRNSQINLNKIIKNINEINSYNSCISEFDNPNQISLKDLTIPVKTRPPSRRSKLGGNIKTIKVVKQY
jgi:hypothetical protein